MARIAKPITPHDKSVSISLADEGFLRQPAVLSIIPVSRSTLWQMVKIGAFPAPVKLSARVSAWRANDVRNFIASRQQ